MITFIEVTVQFLIGLSLLLVGYACTTNLGFSTPKTTEKIIGVICSGLGMYGIYDAVSMFTFAG